MVTVLRAASRCPAMAQITSERSHTVLIEGRSRVLRNTDRLVGGSGWQVLLSKTGFTNQASCYRGMRARAGGGTVLVALMGEARPPGRTPDAMTIRRWLAAERPAALA